MNYENAFQKVIEVIPILLKEFKEPTKVYVGKTEHPKECAIRHEQNDKLFYLTILVEGSPSSISKLESDVIKYLKDSTNIKLVNQSEKSSGNPDADKLYICFDNFLPNDEIGEHELVLPDGLPLSID